MKIHATAQQKMASVPKVSRRPTCHELSTSSLSVVLCTRFEKKTIYSEICRLYISLWSIQVGNDVVSSATYSLFAIPVLYHPCTSRSVHIRREYLFLLQPPTAFPPESTDFLSPVRIDSDAVAAPKLINLGNLSYFPHSSVFSVFISRIYILINFTSRVDLISAFLVAQKIFHFSFNFY